MTTARFTDHAMERMAEREISYEQVQRALELGEITRGTEAGQLKYTHGNISVLVDLKKSLIVTVYKLKKIKKILKERRKKRRRKY